MVKMNLNGVGFSLQQHDDCWVLKGLENDLVFMARTRTEVLGEWADFIYREANGPRDFTSSNLE